MVDKLTKEEKNEILTMFRDRSQILSEQQKVAPTSKLRQTAEEEWNSNMLLWQKMENIFEGRL